MTFAFLTEMAWKSALIGVSALLIATLLTGSPSARLYRRLVVDRELASSVDAQLTPFRDPSLFRLAVTVARGPPPHACAECSTPSPTLPRKRGRGPTAGVASESFTS